jgi:hypothetical protein
MEIKCFEGKVNPVHSSQGISGPKSGSASHASLLCPFTQSGHPTTHAIELWSGPQSGYTSQAITPGHCPQTGTKHTDGYLDTHCLPGMWFMSDPTPGSMASDHLSELQQSKARTDEHVLKTYLVSYLKQNYVSMSGAKLKCDWIFMDYQQNTRAGGGNHVLSPKKFLLVITKVIWRDIGPFDCIDGRRPNQLGLGSISQLFLQDLMYKVKF